MNQKSNQRAATKQAFLTALEGELVSGRALTVEAIAGRAQANKALVYRYFGGLSGLLAAYAADDQFMPSAAELRALCDPNLDALPPRVRFAQCVTACVAALAKRPATVQILLRLPSFDPPTLAALREGRARGIADIRQAFGASDSGLGFDSELAFNLLIAGVCQILGARRLSWLHEETELPELVASVSRTVRGLLIPPSAGNDREGEGRQR
ncbi:TetR/AcrR family transcriptional regulator [Singulisphaera acidiphila]|uniref:Transcriptional regulator, tetR family n=1 Tax=Singulisphaera acidiphila (strain ATCC BAA-1392 / DSM 18658 / VKM B-2454 / MOB10) TaxID=886293 RepID=L0DG61_SINAD|nr:TetR/AcrR family transcriptional regulator [Singulisphaera acidiphila]AGA28252.1 transcriptional regulator, tetR family [Singulisphaera acidiphila DSM 18658]